MCDFSKYLEGKRALSRNQIYEIGFNYEEYENDVSEGIYKGILVMKEWGKKPCLHCYFHLDNGEKIVLTSYFKNSAYRPCKASIDFSDINIKAGTSFILKVGLSKNNKTVWNDAEILNDRRE